MKEIIEVSLFLIFVKLFFFWLWLWQLKEYHIGRFLAHFKEGQAVKKIISGFWRLKYPKFTKKIIVISLAGLILAILMFWKGFYLPAFILIILVPLAFQAPTVIWRKSYLKKARLKREGFKNLLVIGITGSYGKTSTKEFLYEILAEKLGKDKVLKTKEHQNSEVGIARCILRELKPEHEIFIVEMGAYNRGGIKLLCDMVHPKIGILTGINEQHMATFGSQENIIRTKYELIESLPTDGMAFFNEKNKYCLELYNETLRLRSGQAKFKKFLYGQEAQFHGQENILGARVVARELGIIGEDSPLPKLLSIKRGINGLNIIDSTYSANPTGVMAHLDYLKTLPGKKILVMPCLIELGKASKEVHRRIGRKIAEVCDLVIITTGDKFKEIKQGVVSIEAKPQQERGLASTKSTEIIFLENPKKIFEKIKSTTHPGDVVLLESRVRKS